jgi:hypothetical protein
MDEKNNMKFVKFDEYCHTCKYEKEPDTCVQCDECLSYPASQYSAKPINYEKKEK